MIRYNRNLAIPSIALFACAFVTPLAGQSPILLQLQSPAGDRFRADSAGGFVALGTYSNVGGCTGIPATGLGARLMWYPCKAAFRAGNLHNGAGVGLWDDAKIGKQSWAGGDDTEASGNASFAFGAFAYATGAFSIALGENVFATGMSSFAAGASSTCTGEVCVAMGNGAHATGTTAVAIGSGVTASGTNSFALGSGASTNGHAGSFVWADLSAGNVLNQVDNEFRVRAAGGITLRTSAAANSAAGANGNTGCDLPAGSGSWTCASSRYVKENVADVDGDALLEKVHGMPVTTWNYIAEGKEVRHMGPFAQDFYAAFGLGTDSASIGMIDINGVNLAAVKALEQRTADLKAAQAALEEKTRRLELLEERVARLERVVGRKTK